ncbi:MAG: hypothetical protein IJT95_03360 [Abditibacteriota bacterium]|nr:hypothetical protein [Abditibacteriota bacterium]
MGGRGQKRDAKGRFEVHRWKEDKDVPEEMKIPGVKFLVKIENENDRSLPAESALPNAIYAIRNDKGGLKQITFYDENCLARLSIDFGHDHKKYGDPHGHNWYWDENNKSRRPGHTLTNEENKWQEDNNVQTR